MLSAIVQLAHVLGFEVIAEGAETGSQIDVLRTLDCDYIQGFYYAQPAPVHDRHHCALRTSRKRARVVTPASPSGSRRD